MSLLQKISLTALALLIAGTVALGVWKISGTIPATQWLKFILHKDTNPLLFIGLMVLLPCIGAPISLFLVLSGIKFGFGWGFLLTTACTGIHLLLTYPLAQGLVFSHLAPLLERYGKQVPQIPPHRAVRMAVIFTAVPGLPYSLKNYLLAASGIPFSTYLVVAWPIHLLAAVPFIGIGNFAFDLNIPMLILFLLLLAASSLAVHTYRRQWSRVLDAPPPEEPEKRF
ncbi:MAG: hypothetical protein ACQESV_09070 [Thermodesulfobacteriota bacterium]